MKIAHPIYSIFYAEDLVKRYGLGQLCGTHTTVADHDLALNQGSSDSKSSGITTELSCYFSVWRP